MLYKSPDHSFATAAAPTAFWHYYQFEVVRSAHSTPDMSGAVRGPPERERALDPTIRPRFVEDNFDRHAAGLPAGAGLKWLVPWHDERGSLTSNRLVSSGCKPVTGGIRGLERLACRTFRALTALLLMLVTSIASVKTPTAT